MERQAPITVSKYIILLIIAIITIIIIKLITIMLNKKVVSEQALLILCLGENDCVGE